MLHQAALEDMIQEKSQRVLDHAKLEAPCTALKRAKKYALRTSLERKY
jgi:hypothetical protein